MVELIAEPLGAFRDHPLIGVAELLATAWAMNWWQVPFQSMDTMEVSHRCSRAIQGSL